MSGGHFNHLDSSLMHEMFGINEKPRNIFEDREISELVFDVFQLIHAYDYYVSGDSSKETYQKAKYAFKEKWFETPIELRIKAVVDEAVEELRAELYATFGIEPTGDAPMSHREKGAANYDGHGD